MGSENGMICLYDLTEEKEKKVICAHNNYKIN